MDALIEQALPPQSRQVNRTVQIPLTGAPWVLLQIPYPMTEENWKEMEAFLAVVKRPLTQGRTDG